MAVIVRGPWYPVITDEKWAIAHRENAQFDRDQELEFCELLGLDLASDNVLRDVIAVTRIIKKRPSK